MFTVPASYGYPPPAGRVQTVMKFSSQTLSQSGPAGRRWMPAARAAWKYALNQVYNWSAPAVLAGIFFAFSLAPSLLPRPIFVQGVLSGLSLAAGYALGIAGIWLWHYLQLPVPPAGARRVLGAVSALFCVLIILVFLWQASTWQDNVRALMGMEPSAGTRPWLLTAVSVLIFGALLLVARLFRRLFHWISVRLHRYLPARVSYLLGFAAAFFIFWTLVNDVFLRSVLQMADSSFQQLDALIEDDWSPPPHSERAGSAPSLVDWHEMGRKGRSFVASGPDAADLSEFFETALPTPVRVYVGLNSAPTAEERAGLALNEMIRTGGFDRSVLLLVTPTGTGWIDPAALDTVEYLHRGDIATVAVQYSYLNSPLALLTEGDYGAEMARVLFDRIYRYWNSLPPENRPRLYLHGLSLGALNSDLSFNIYDIIDEPFDGALWSGPPFRTQTWRRITAQRDPRSPAWLPTFRDGSVVRFMNQQGMPPAEEEWGGFRIVFLQYASDPITFFTPAMMWRKPDWMRHPRGPDVTPDLRWFPFVTFLQLLTDMIVGTAPSGFGHNYAPEDYIDAWFALTEPEGWSPSDLQRLKDRFELRKLDT